MKRRASTACLLLLLSACSDGIDEAHQGLPAEEAAALFDAPTGKLSDANATDAMKQVLRMGRFDLSGAAQQPQIGGASA